MSTSKLLQTPKIISITGSTISIEHPVLTDYPKTYLASQLAAAGTAMSVYDNNGFSDDDWFIIGQPGDSKTEENDVNGTVTRGQSLTVTNTLKFSHELDSSVTKILERGIKIYGTNTTVAAGVLIASVDAITTPIADAVMIQWDKEHTEYTMITTDTSYSYYFAKFCDATTTGSASALVSASGPTSSSVEYIMRQALDMANADFNEGLSRPFLIRAVNDAQTAIMQFSYQDPRSNLIRSVDWDFEKNYDTSVPVVENQTLYDLSSLALKYPNSKAIISVALGDSVQLEKLTQPEMDDLYVDRHGCVTTSLVSIGDTSIVVDDNSTFDDSGSFYLGSEIITYTGKTGTTQFTGIPASGSGSITATHAIGSHVWQNVQPATPASFSVDNHVLQLSVPPETSLAGWPIRVRFYKKLTALTKSDDTTEVTFQNVMQTFVASRIETRRQNLAKAKEYMAIFNDLLRQNAQKKDTVLKRKRIIYKYQV